MHLLTLTGIECNSVMRKSTCSVMTLLYLKTEAMSSMLTQISEFSQAAE